MRRYISFIIILFSLLSAQIVRADANSPTFKLSGDVTLLSHYVENGLSQTDKSPSLQGSFWFNFGPQFRLGVWGSNTNYPDSEDHFNLRLIGDIKVNFSPTSTGSIHYSKSQYYKAGDRNGDIFGINLTFDKFRVLYDTFSNWEGTSKRSSRYAFGFDFPVFTSWTWVNEAGYDNPKVDKISPYFDLRTGLGSKFGAIYLEGSVTGTSNSGQFDNGAGDVFFILSAKTDF